MRDIIQLLPDAVANQIAAGEVVQRPASVVKELLENSLDAGATSIKLVVRDSGKSLIQVIDNGNGMTETDARLAFERHATSKIKQADDLFKLTTKGFRGEALASIAAVAQVELKTKRDGEDLGTGIRIEGSVVQNQDFCQTAAGTIISVKNLFFNIPARRNFLKSDQVEFKHIVDEFERVALAHPDVAFQLINKQHTVFDLHPGKLRQRIAAVLGKKFNERLVPVNEQTDVVKLSGFVIKPEFARKTRGEQFFFVNNRFIKNHYLHHAINDAFEVLIPGNHHPGYFLFMDIEPSRIDVNIHPTKTEIKFDDEKAIYAIIRVSVKHALGQFNVTPTIDFEREQAFETPPLKPGEVIQPPTIQVNPHFNPFESDQHHPPKEKKGSSAPFGHRSGYQTIPKNQPWETAFAPAEQIDQFSLQANFEKADDKKPEGHIFQLFGTFIARGTKTSMMLIHQQRAHERILYEKFIRTLANQSGASQQLLFPHQINMKAGELALLHPYLDDLRQLGFDVEFLGNTQLVIQGIPFLMDETESIQALEEFIEGLKNNQEAFKLNKSHELALLLARHGATKPGKILSTEEMLHLADQLFACDMPQHSPTGKPVLVQVTKEYIDKLFD